MHGQEHGRKHGHRCMHSNKHRNKQRHGHSTYAERFKGTVQSLGAGVAHIANRLESDTREVEGSKRRAPSECKLRMCV